MDFLFIVGLIVTLAGGYLALLNSSPRPLTPRGTGIVIVIVGVALVLSRCVTFVGTGEVKVRSFLGVIDRESYYTEGGNFVYPWVVLSTESIKSEDFVNAGDDHVDGPSADGGWLFVDSNVPIGVNPAAVPYLMASYTEHWNELVSARVRGALRGGIGQVRWQESLSRNRGPLRDASHREIERELLNLMHQTGAPEEIAKNAFRIGDLTFRKVEPQPQVLTELANLTASEVSYQTQANLELVEERRKGVNAQRGESIAYLIAGAMNGRAYEGEPTCAVPAGKTESVCTLPNPSMPALTALELTSLLGQLGSFELNLAQSKLLEAMASQEGGPDNAVSLILGGHPTPAVPTTAPAPR